MTPIDFKAAMKFASESLVVTGYCSVDDVNLARSNLALLKAMWPGVEIHSNIRRYDGITWGPRSAFDQTGHAWCSRANAFERTTSIRVDDPELIKAMEGVK